MNKIVLDFYKSDPGAYVEYYDNQPGNVLIIHESYEQTKNRPYSDSYVLATIFVPFNMSLNLSPLRIKRKLTINLWLQIGISDWESVIQVNENQARRYMIIGTFEKSSL